MFSFLIEENTKPRNNKRWIVVTHTKLVGATWQHLSKLNMPIYFNPAISYPEIHLKETLC